ncbi:MAG: hypothetical protein JNJ92_04400 [Altererythrobacter sp.]|nr:hypothetical protein [Altererythrobacter sp.]
MSKPQSSDVADRYYSLRRPIATACVVLTFWLLALNVMTGSLSFMTKEGVGARSGMVGLIEYAIEALLISPFGRPASAITLFVAGCVAGMAIRGAGRSPTQSRASSTDVNTTTVRSVRPATFRMQTFTPTESDLSMIFRISKAQLDDILTRAQAVEAEFLRFANVQDLDAMRGDALSMVGPGFDNTILQRLESGLADLDDVSLAEAAAISVAGDGSYGPEEVQELVADLMERTSREERLKMFTGEPLIGSMLANGMSCLGLAG